MPRTCHPEAPSPWSMGDARKPQCQPWFLHMLKPKMACFRDAEILLFISLPIYLGVHEVTAHHPGILYFLLPLLHSFLLLLSCSPLSLFLNKLLPSLWLWRDKLLLKISAQLELGLGNSREAMAERVWPAGSFPALTIPMVGPKTCVTDQSSLPPPYQRASTSLPEDGQRVGKRRDRK